jgi:hypothetical protein
MLGSLPVGRWLFGSVIAGAKLAFFERLARRVLFQVFLNVASTAGFR